MPGMPVAAPLPNIVPMLNMVPAVVVENQKKADIAAQEAALAGPSSSSLLSFLNQRKQEATYAKENSGVTDMLLDAQRRRDGKHSDAKLSQLQKYKMPVYWVPVTQTKCIHSEAWLRDLLMPYADKIWALYPTEMPELQDSDREKIFAAVIDEAISVMAGGEPVTDEQIEKVEHKASEVYRNALIEEAKEKADQMERVIQDQHEECDFRAIFREFQANLVTYGTAFIKGPFTIQKKFPKWQNGKRIVADKLIPTCSAPSPHDIFPAPWAVTEHEGYIIERIKTYREGLSSVRTLEHYQTKEIEALLSETRTPVTSNQYGDDQRSDLEKKSQCPPDDRFECWQFTGPVPGYMLAEWGIAGCDAAADYNMECLWSGTHIIKVVPRWNEVSEGPYFRGCFKTRVGSFWGVGVPHLMQASQDRANMLMIAMIDNTNWASGPIGWIDLNALVNIDDAKDFHPRKLIPVQSRPGQTGSPMGFQNIDLKVGELNSLYMGALSDADNESGVPAYMYGSGSNSSAGGTYAGLATLMNAAARGIKDALLEIDTVITRFVQHWADWNNTYSDDENIKGDIRVVCSGATGLFVQEMMLDKLDNMIAQSVPMMGLTGPGFVLDMLRQKAKALKVDTSDLPTRDEIRMMKKNQEGQKPTPVKPTLSISAKWETLSDLEKKTLMSEIGVPEDMAAQPPPGGVQNAPVQTTGTPGNLPAAAVGA